MSLILFSRPRDRSLQAFKDWIQGMAYPLHPQAKKTIITRQWIDEEGWADNWRRFWEKVDKADGASKSPGPGEG